MRSWIRFTPTRRSAPAFAPAFVPAGVSPRTLTCVPSIGGALAVAASLLLGTGCSMADLTRAPDPSSVVSADAAKTPQAGLSMYDGVRAAFATVYGGGNLAAAGWSYALINGVFSDEYTWRQYNTTQALYNLRAVTSVTPANTYNDLHTVRLNIDQAIGTLRKYGDTTQTPLIGELYALKGYIYIMFAELYCSGVPFSYAVFEGDVVLDGAESTEQMLTHATTLFDSATTFAGDSTSVQRLAMVGKARALLDLGRPSDAATLVTATNVPTTYVYATTYTMASGGPSSPNYLGYGLQGSNSWWLDAFMSDRAGTNGLNYVSAGNAGDPRVASYIVGAFTPDPTPAKFPTGSTPIHLADGIEARLIEAEAALAAHQVGTWATILNTLRQTASTPAIPPLTADSTTGAASDSARLDVMFRERAFWLFGTGHRTGDLRRLIRQYGRQAQTVFPVGTQTSFSPSYLYGDQVNVAPPMTESNNNPQYHGCINRDA